MEGLEFEIYSYFIIFMRIQGFIIIAPLFGRRNVPAIIKIGFSLLLSIVLYNTVDKSVFGGRIPEEEGYMYQYIFRLAEESITGLMLGFVSYAMFTAIYVAGQIIDMEIGFGVVNVIDPLSNIQVPITANFYFIIAMVAFLAFRGHHILIKSLFESYDSIPPGSAFFRDSMIGDITKLFGNIFIIGFKIAAPVTAAVLISDVALGIISRTIPQFNVFIVGMPLKIALGIGIMLVSIPVFIELLTDLFSEISDEMLIFIKGMIKG